MLEQELNSDADRATKQTVQSGKKQTKSIARKKLNHPNLSREYTDDIGMRICELISEGLSYEKVQEIVKEAPSWGTLIKWRSQNRGFDSLYRVAKIAQVERFMDQLIDIADNSRDAAMAAVRIKTRQWLAAKRMPQVYGDSIKLEVEETQAPEMTPFEAARRLAFALQSAQRQVNSPIMDNMSQAIEGEMVENTGSIKLDSK